MPQEANVYFFTCHMLYTAMQVYYEFHEQKGLEIAEMGEQARKWGSAYERIMGWCLEEIVFPFEHERISDDKAKDMGDFAETRDEMMGKRIYHEILASSHHIRERQPKLKLNALVYYHFFTFLANILEKFATIMNSKNMISTQYSGHYQLESAFFKSFRAQLENEESLDKSIGKDISTEIRSSAEQLGIEWNKSVFAAVQDFAGSYPRG
jgi:hypothetical protein